MARDFKLMRSFSQCWSSSLLACLALWTCASVAVGGSAGSSQETYTWSAELVAIDEAANTIDVRALVAGHADLEALPSLSEGERVTVVWSGLTRGTAIRGIHRDGETSFDGLALPAEFISSERDGRYVVFRVPLPEDAVQAIGALSQGEWVTLESPRSSADWNEAVAHARPYNHVE